MVGKNATFLSWLLLLKLEGLSPLFLVQSLAGTAAEPEHPQLAVGILFPEIAQDVFTTFRKKQQNGKYQNLQRKLMKNLQKMAKLSQFTHLRVSM